jgi:branched-chain amino acid transport system substrate-binding protein
MVMQFAFRRLLLGITFGIAAFTSDFSAYAAAPVKIGISLGLSGRYQAPSAMQKRAYELWRDEVNARGGLLGRKVELTIRDDRGEASVAAAIYREFVGRKSIDHVIGPYSSELTAAVAPIVDAAGYPMLAAGAAADEIWARGYRNVLGMWTPASRYSQGMLRLAHESGLREIAIVHADDPFSEAIARGARKWAPYLKLRVVLDLGFRKGTGDLTDAMRRAMDAKAEVVLVAGHRAEAVNARRAAARLNWMPRAFFATVGPALPGWITIMGPEADGVFATSIWEPHESVTYPRSREFSRAFRNRYGIDPSYHAATAYAAGQILEAALAHAKSLERSAIREALFGLDMQSVIGRFTVDHTGMQVKRLEMIIQWQRGRKEIVWPAEVRSAHAIVGAARQ